MWKWQKDWANLSILRSTTGLKAQTTDYCTYRRSKATVVTVRPQLTRASFCMPLCARVALTDAYSQLIYQFCSQNSLSMRT